MQWGRYISQKKAVKNEHVLVCTLYIYEDEVQAIELTSVIE